MSFLQLLAASSLVRVRGSLGWVWKAHPHVCPPLLLGTLSPSPLCLFLFFVSCLRILVLTSGITPSQAHSSHSCLLACRGRGAVLLMSLWILAGSLSLRLSIRAFTTVPTIPHCQAVFLPVRLWPQPPDVVIIGV